jgi:hypothetical protein
MNTEEEKSNAMNKFFAKFEANARDNFDLQKFQNTKLCWLFL